MPSYLVAGKEIPFYAIGITDADLNMVFIPKTSAGIKLLAFHENASHGIEWPYSFLSPFRMQALNDSTI